jgi:hypothetical protein
MRKFTKARLTGGIVAGVLAASVVGVSAATLQTPAQIAAGLTGREVQSIIDERNHTGKSYGRIAADAGQLEAFKASVLQNRKAATQRKVHEGRLTQEQGDKIMEQLQQRQETCDGSGNGSGRQNGGGRNGTCDGSGNGRQNGNGSKEAGEGSGNGSRKQQSNHTHSNRNGSKHGQGLRDGSCAE